MTAIDVAESSHTRLVLDVTCSAGDADHAELLEQAVDAVEGVEVHKVSDRTFLLHIGGKIEVSSKVPLSNRDDLSMAYTPGVGRVSMAIAENPEDVRRLTIKGNSVAVVTDGSAVLGLGNIGPGAALPVMEGKAALFKRFADIDAWPICLASQDTDEIVRAVEMIAPGFGGINLEDIAAPRCFEIEQRLRASLDIPVFHDDQHGTAIVVLAALTNAMRVVEKDLATARVVVAGAGAAGTAIVTLLLAAGVTDVVVYDRVGCLVPDLAGLSPAQVQLAEVTNPRRVTGDLHDALAPTAAPTSSSASARPASSTPSGSTTWPTARSSSPWPTPTRRSTPARPASTPPWSPRAAPTTPTRSTTCSRSPASSAACSTPGPPRSPSTCCCAPPRRSPTSCATTSSTRASSSPRSSTPTCPRPSRPRSAASQPERVLRGPRTSSAGTEVDQLVEGVVAQPAVRRLDRDGERVVGVGDRDPEQAVAVGAGSSGTPAARRRPRAPARCRRTPARGRAAPRRIGARCR